MMTILLRVIDFLRRDHAYFARVQERSRCVVMVEAMAERWRLLGVSEFAAEFTDLAERMRDGR